MKRIGRLLFDVAGLALAAFAIVMGLIAVTGHIPSSIKDSINTANAAWAGRETLMDVYPTAFWMGVVALAMGAIAAISSAIGIVMLFKSDSHVKLTIFAWVFAWIAAGLAGYVVYQIWNIDPQDIIDAGKNVAKQVTTH